ncbi:DotU family type IV/VI secretion system protein [Paraburkholderia sp. J11-2]|uniref:DotU family type IV/VI secretion system protein n=1 Tax=Paraburkholderia sp. J11-2 TaxID=2805431 RepID=UPI002AB6C36E|nr:DotU family type IV/VI secretion system protein [Paraburkholderia sp. J11-2]
MIGLNFRRNFNRTEPALQMGRSRDVVAAPGEPPVSGIRDLLRNTALLVTSVTEGGIARTAGSMQKRCRELIHDFADGLHQRGYPDDVCMDARIAQCGLLDEVALRHLAGNDRATWELRPLQVEFFDMHDAGERVFERLEKRLRAPVANVDLLECYSSVLGMGFIGRYALDGEARLDELASALNTRISKSRTAATPPFTTDHTVRRPSDWLYRLSSWAILGICCVVAALLWLVWHGGLDMQLAQLLSGKSRP